jgi:hypothetical protein
MSLVLVLDGTCYFYVFFVVEPGCQYISESAFLVRDEDIDRHGYLPAATHPGACHMSSQMCTLERSLETRVQGKVQPVASM